MESIIEALDSLRQGKMIIVVDDENRENEGDLICPASTITAEQVNFMASFGKGLICVALPPEQIDHLGLFLMSRDKEEFDAFKTAFTYSVDAKKGITTGISAHDRALTIRLAVNPATPANQLVVPGHIFPLRAKSGGVFERRGHTEAAVDLTRLAGTVPGGVICEILKDDGSMMRLSDLKIFAKEHRLPLVSIHDLVEYRLSTEIKKVCETTLPTPWGLFNQEVYKDVAGREHIIMSLGNVAHDSKPLVRIHSECLTGDVFESLRCDCGAQLKHALQLIGNEKCGMLLYLRQEGRGIGLTEKIKSYVLQDQGFDTVGANHALGYPADLRRYEVAVKMLRDHGVNSIKLLTNNPHKISYLENYCIEVERVSLLIDANQYNMRYYQSKVEKMGHFIPFVNDVITSENSM